jgi:NAD(P)-dependent dehydrogenase (short-subunit alcohol dehydrogenase family)
VQPAQEAPAARLDDLRGKVVVLTGGTRGLGLAMACVNCVMAGPFATDASKDWPAEDVATVSASLALGRMGQPREIVAAALYLASSASSYTTGAVPAVHGGTP